ncbi:MAG: hypothetical protein R2681_09820 [Pyrinomonadaceae bacterium]
MAVPDKIKIKRIPNYFTKCIGKYKIGQFMTLITATIRRPLTISNLAREAGEEHVARSECCGDRETN